METYRFTGNPFVDAGIAGMCAAADVSRPEELDANNIEAATNRLIRLLTSPQALEPYAKPGDPKKTSAFATSEMSAIFPNGPHANPAIKLKDKSNEYITLTKKLLSLIDETSENEYSCFVCGNSATLSAQKMNFPLVDSADRRNFHPGLNPGHPICAKCALAVQFLPVSILRTNLSGNFWFVSAIDPEIAIAASSQFTLPLMETAIARNERIRFYGDWIIPGRASSVVSVIEFLTGKNHQLGLSGRQWPVRAFFFSNDNRSPNLSVIDIPAVLFKFFSSLRITDNHFKKFIREVLHANQIGETTSRKMLDCKQIISNCIVETNENIQKLLGGWFAHRLYMKVVLGMKDKYIKNIEEVAIRIAESADPNGELKDIKMSKSPIVWFLSAIKKGLISKEELYVLMPPNDYYTGNASLDYITAASLDILNQKESGFLFETWDETIPESNDTHPIIQLVESAGDKVINSNYEPKKLFNNLGIAKSISQIRNAWMKALSASAIGWVEFKALVPPGDVGATYTIRDYMIAYLIDRMRNQGRIDEIENTVVAVIADNTNNEGEEEWHIQ